VRSESYRALVTLVLLTAESNCSLLICCICSAVFTPYLFARQEHSHAKS
jgi:hypothetical protein